MIRHERVSASIGTANIPLSRYSINICIKLFELRNEIIRILDNIKKLCVWGNNLNIMHILGHITRYTGYLGIFQILCTLPNEIAICVDKEVDKNSAEMATYVFTRDTEIKPGSQPRRLISRIAPDWSVRRLQIRGISAMLCSVQLCLRIDLLCARIIFLCFSYMAELILSLTANQQFYFNAYY